MFDVKLYVTWFNVLLFRFDNGSVGVNLVESVCPIIKDVHKGRIWTNFSRWRSELWEDNNTQPIFSVVAHSIYRTVVSVNLVWSLIRQTASPFIWVNWKLLSQLVASTQNRLTLIFPLEILQFIFLWLKITVSEYFLGTESVLLKRKRKTTHGNTQT